MTVCKRTATVLLLVLTLAVTISGPEPALRDGGIGERLGDVQGNDHACRFWGIIATAAQDSLVHDHLVGGEYSLMSLAGDNPDGWSVAYHSPALVAAGLARSQILRGWPRADHATDGRYRDAVTEMVSMGALCGIAHIRDASPGARIGIPNPHSFRREGVTFAHNGGLSESGLVSLLEEGSPDYLGVHPPDYEGPYLDSELLFMYVLKIREEGPPRTSGREGTSLRDAIVWAVHAAYGAGAIETAANCIATTGDSILVVRFDLDDEEKYRVRYRAIPTGWVVSSEPVGSDTTGWSVLPPKSIGVFKAAAPPMIMSMLPEWQELVVSGQTVDDDLTGDSAGNADGGCDAGEQIELVVSLRNVGSSTAGSVTATLATTDQYCLITDDTEVYGDIGAGEEIACADDFDIAIDPSCPDGHTALFTLHVESIERPTWDFDVQLDVEAPTFEPHGYVIDDASGGNGDGHVDPGESFDLTPVLANTGAEDATGLELSLSLAHPEASVLSGDAALAVLPAGGTASPSPPFAVEVGAGAGDPDVLFSEVSVNADWGQSGMLEFLIAVGGFWDEMESGQGNWTSYAVTGGFLDEWHLSTQRNFTANGTSSWKCGASGVGDYANLLDAALESEPVALRAHSFLRFRHWMDAEVSGGTPGCCYDGGMVELSVNGGPWMQIHPVGGYTHRTIDGSVQGPWPADTEVYSGDIDWEEALFEVAGCSGTARFRFRFGSDGAYAGEGWYIDDIEFFGADDVPTGAQEMPSDAPTSIGLSCPNPLSAPSTITYRLPETARVTLRVYDPSGRLVRSFDEGRRPAGTHVLDWDGRDADGRELANGMYFARLVAGDDTALHKFVVLK
ncbi:T9SS type A sorting domain-containing protein [bacterium]|nr:T9SS type A sorting domain-containing protein [bacterium]